MQILPFSCISRWADQAQLIATCPEGRGEVQVGNQNGPERGRRSPRAVPGGRQHRGGSLAQFTIPRWLRPQSGIRSGEAAPTEPPSRQNALGLPPQSGKIKGRIHDPPFLHNAATTPAPCALDANILSGSQIQVAPPLPVCYISSAGHCPATQWPVCVTPQILRELPSTTS